VLNFSEKVKGSTYFLWKSSEFFLIDAILLKISSFVLVSIGIDILYTDIIKKVITLFKMNEMPLQCLRCKNNEAIFMCVTCESFKQLCTNCDSYVHGLPSKKKHKRNVIVSESKLNTKGVLPLEEEEKNSRENQKYTK
jgi:hypothetical protein